MISRHILSLNLFLSFGHLKARAMSIKTASSSRVAVGQLRSTDCKAKCLMDAAFCARKAKEEGALMLFLPENYGFMPTSPQEAIDQAESTLDGDVTARNPLRLTEAIQQVIDGIEPRILMDEKMDNTSVSLLDGLRVIASSSGLWISACVHTKGATPSIDGKQRIHNTHFILDAAGSIKAKYHKIHLFDVSIPGQVELRESNSTAPGNQIVVCDSPIGRLGLSTCYDVRFPQLYTELVNRGAEVILVPSAFTVPTGKAHWHTLLTARAIETQCFVIAAAQFGVHSDRRESYGHSLVVDPWGVLLADAGGVDSLETVPDPPSVVTCTIDLDRLHQVRQRMPVQQHRMNARFN